MVFVFRHRRFSRWRWCSCGCEDVVRIGTKPWCFNELKVLVAEQGYKLEKNSIK